MASWKPIEEIKKNKKLAEETGELIPGMREQGKGIKCYVQAYLNRGV